MTKRAADATDSPASPNEAGEAGELHHCRKHHRPYALAVMQAVHVLQIPHSPKGVSTQAIKKYIDEHGMSSDFADGWEKRLNKTFESMTEHGTLSKIKASFRLTKEGKGEYHTMWAKDHPDEAEEEHLTLLEKRRVAAEAKTKEKEGGGKTPKISGGVEKPRATKAAKAH